MSSVPILRLGYLVPQFPGQTHIFFWREIAELEARGVEVHLLSTRPPPPGLIAHDWSDDAIARTTYLVSYNPFDALRAAPRQNWPALMREIRRDGRAFAKDIAVSLPAATRLRAYAKAHKLDHVHAHSCGRTALIAAMARRMGGPEYSVTLHGPLSDYGPGQRVKWRDARFATVITQKLLREMREEMPEDMPSDVSVRPMGVDTNVLSRTAPYVPYTGTGPLRLFSCARLHVVKGHQDAMQAVRLLVDRGLDVQLEIAGEDDDGGNGFRSVLEQTMKDLSLENNVTLLGPIDADAVRGKLLEADIFVLASWHEPLGVAYMEAMSCEVPTIGTASGGVPEMIESGETGLLVPPKDPEALADGIAQLAQDPELARTLSTKGRAHMVQNFRAALGAETLIDGIARYRGGLA